MTAVAARRYPQASSPWSHCLGKAQQAPGASSQCHARLLVRFHRVRWSCAVPTEPVVQARQVSKSYGGMRVLDGIDLEICRGEMVGLIGASGSGKSTLIRAIAGLTPIDRSDVGDILLFSQ